MKEYPFLRRLISVEIGFLAGFLTPSLITGEFNELQVGIAVILCLILGFTIWAWSLNR